MIRYRIPCPSPGAGSIFTLGADLLCDTPSAVRWRSIIHSPGSVFRVLDVVHTVSWNKPGYCPWMNLLKTAESSE
ncbi:hypothetical protein D3OALGA1CA_1037 [Olavius algarvensis associated proteobacterium Delta 3]|nr:hypothetical protein D3OALGA1CA_1037 [Olavius algarvensis associated proteobacterium Delta 3]